MTGLILAVAFLAALGAASLIGVGIGYRLARRLDEQHAHVNPFRVHAWQARNADTERLRYADVERIARHSYEARIARAA